MFSSTAFKKGLVIFIAIVLAALLIAQILIAPKLVTYQSNDKQVTNLYWLNLDGSAQLSDTNESFVKLDETTANLHICHSFSEAENCQVYKVVDTGGSFSALYYLFQEHLLKE